jgi:hypothetical protein
MLSSSAAKTAPSVYRRLAQQQFASLLLRLLGVLLLGWTMQWHLLPLSAWHGSRLSESLNDPFIRISFLYVLISAGLFLAQMTWVNKRWLFVASSVVDGGLATLLLALFPGQAWLGFGIAAVAFLAMLQGFSGRFVSILSIVLIVAALLVAHLAGILAFSEPVPSNAAAGFLTLCAVIAAWRFEATRFDKGEIESDVHAISGLPLLRTLHTSLHYLLPYHQRNKIPMSMVMVHLVGKIGNVDHMQMLATNLLRRIRRSDVLAHLNDDNLVILLCDTSVSGASVLAKDLASILLPVSGLKLSFAVSQIALDNAAIDPLLRRMQGSLEQAKQQQTDRVIFVTEEKQENISL